MSAVTGLGPLLRVALRRDRIMLPAWLGGLFLFAYVSAAGTVGLYPDPVARSAVAAGLGDNLATVALYGPALDLSTMGGLAGWKMSGFGTALLALMCLLVVGRHTRAEEESGRLELLGAAPLGRYAALTAAVIVAAGAAVLAGPLIATGFVLGGVPGPGTFTFGLALSAAALCFTGLAAVAAQLTESARAATSIGLSALLVAYLLRAAGDSTGPGWLSWLSPIGWAQQIRPWSEPRWWVFALAAGVALALTAAGYALHGRRDLGAGLWPARTGRAHAPATLTGPVGLAWRLQRGTFLGWLAGFVVLGLVVGSIASTLSSLVGDSTATAGVLADLARGQQQGLADTVIAAYFALLGLAASGYAVQAVLRLRAEEAAGRVEPLLGAPVGRTRWALSHLGVAILGSAALLVAAGLAGGIVHGLRTGDLPGQLPRVLGVALVEIPASWVLAGVTIALFGLAPRVITAAWAVLAAFLALGELGPLLRLPQWAMDLSPFTHLPTLPGATVSATPLIWLTVVAAGLAGVGLAGFRGRDLAI